MEPLLVTVCNAHPLLKIILLVVSNILYLWPAWTSLKIHYFELASLLLTVSILSTIHHLCFDGGLCFGVPWETFSNLDVAYALIATGVTLMSAFIYEMLMVRRLGYFVHKGYTIREYMRLPLRTTYQTSVVRGTRPVEERHVLLKHSYADIFIIFFITIMIVTVFTTNRTLIVYGIMAGFVTLTGLIHVLRYRHLKKRAYPYRYHGFSLFITIVLVVTSILIFQYLEGIEGRCVHSMWHITGALACQSFLMATTGYFL